MKLPKAEHESRPWRIHDVVPDFRLEDVWALPTPGGPDDFQRLLDLMGSFDPSDADSRAARFLWAFRDRLGAWLDLGEISSAVEGREVGELPIPGTGETSLIDRLPADLRGTGDQSFIAVPFVPLYRADREAAAEISNKTVHGVVHLSWVEGDDGRYEGRMAVYVKPRGLFGRGYMALIKPFRYQVVYPALMRSLAKAWKAQEPAGSSAPASSWTERNRFGTESL